MRGGQCHFRRQQGGCHILILLLAAMEVLIIRKKGVCTITELTLKCCSGEILPVDQIPCIVPKYPNCFWRVEGKSVVRVLQQHCAGGAELSDKSRVIIPHVDIGISHRELVLIWCKVEIQTGLFSVDGWVFVLL